MSVVNTTDSAKAVKVRYIEGKNSAEVLDFNLFLSATTSGWRGVIKTADGAGVYTPDKSCTVPGSIRPRWTRPICELCVCGIDGAGDTLDRTREGYIEIIEMGAIRDPVEASVTHGSDGIPPCWLKPSLLADATVSAAVGAPTGGLFGGTDADQRAGR